MEPEGEAETLEVIVLWNEAEVVPVRLKSGVAFCFFCCGPHVCAFSGHHDGWLNTPSLPVVAPHGDDDRDAFVHFADMFSGIPRWR